MAFLTNGDRTDLKREEAAICAESSSTGNKDLISTAVSQTGELELLYSIVFSLFSLSGRPSPLLLLDLTSHSDSMIQDRMSYLYCKPGLLQSIFTMAGAAENCGKFVALREVTRAEHATCKLSHDSQEHFTE